MRFKKEYVDKYGVKSKISIEKYFLRIQILKETDKHEDTTKTNSLMTKKNFF